MTLWILLYFFEIVFWLWILKFKGIESDLGRFLCLPILYCGRSLNTREEKDVVKIIGWIAVISHTIFFFFGLFSENFRESYLNY